MPTDPHPRASTPDDEGALWPLLGAVRRRLWLVVALAAVAVAVAAATVSQRTAVYRAEAQILVTPFPTGDAGLAGVRLLRESNDGERDLQTATALLTSTRAAADAARAVGRGTTAAQVERDVALQPVGGSSIVAVAATASDPRLAADLANAYARAAIAGRSAEVRAQAQVALQAVAGRTGDEAEATRQGLQTLREQGDPTVAVSQAAAVPTAPEGPSAPLVLAAAALVGLVLGTIGAVLLERGDRRVRDRAELLGRVPVPVLAGVPGPPRGGARIDTDPASREAFRTLQIQLDLRGEADDGRVLLVTSASAGDGKTSTVLNLAFALVGAGHRVIVVDFDLRAPRLSAALGLPPAPEVIGALTGGAGVAEVMRPAPLLAPLRVVPVAAAAGDAALLPTLSRRMVDLLEEARGLADYVLVDTAPLGEVGDALPLLEHADDVLLVGRPGATDRRALDTMAGLLERAGATATGWVVAGVEAPASRYHDAVEVPARRRRRRPVRA